VLCGSALIDRPTGKTYWKVERPPAYNGSEGRARAVLSNYHVLYEFAAPGATKVLYKSVAVGGKREIDEALRTVRGDKWAPDDAAATTRPVNGTVSLAQVAAQRDWTVEVTVVRRPNAAAWDKQIELEQGRLRQLEQVAQQKRVYANQSGGVGNSPRIVVTRDVFGNQQRRSAPPSPLAAAAVADAERAEEERKKQNGTILRMQRERQVADATRTIVARTDGGSTVLLDLDGPAMARVADATEAGSKLAVTGTGRVVDGEVRIRPKSITPAGAPTTKPVE
jgi:hypothetical protein